VPIDLSSSRMLWSERRTAVKHPVRGISWLRGGRLRRSSRKPRASPPLRGL